MIQEEHDARKKSWGGDRKSSGEINHLKSESSKAAKIRPEIAREHNISEASVKTAVEVGRGIDRAEEVVPGIKSEILSGELKASKKDIAAIRRLESDEEVRAAVEDIRNPKPRRENRNDLEDVKTGEHKEMSHSEKIALSKKIDEVASLVSDTKTKHIYTEQDAEEEFEILMNEFVGKIRRVIEVRNDVVKGSKKLKSLLYMFSNEIKRLKEEI